MFDVDDSEERNYFGRQKPFDEYAMGVVQIHLKENYQVLSIIEIENHKKV
jgi:hypothetical protein